MRADRWKSVVEAGGRQHGVVSSSQLRAIGVSRDAIRCALASGLLLPFRKGVLELAGAAPSAFRPLMAACLAGGPFTAASHFAGGWLYASPFVAPGALEVTVYGDWRQRLDGVRCHRSVFLDEADRAVVKGIPTTSPARTVMDLAASVSAWLLPQLLDDFLRRHLCTPEEVMACVERIGGRGRAGTAFLRVLAQERIDGHHPGDNKWEVRLARALINAGFHVVQQHQVVVGNRVLVVDCAVPEYKVGVEFKGWEPRATRTGFDHDAEREVLLTGVGWLIIPATSRTKHADVIRAVREAIKGRSHPHKRHLDEEGSGGLGRGNDAGAPDARAVVVVADERAFPQRDEK